MAIDLILVGGGGHCRSCIGVIELCQDFRIAGIVDNNLAKGEDIMGYPVLGGDDDLAKLKESGLNNAIITVGQINSPAIRIRLYQNLQALGYILPAIISPTAHVCRSATIASGTIIMHQALVNPGAKIGENCIINSKALIEHDSTIGNNCHISTGAIVNGTCSIGNGSFIGSHSTLVNDISITENSFIRAHKFVVRSN